MYSLLTALLQRPSWLACLEHRTIKILTDNQSLAADVQHMSGAPAVFPYVVKLYELAARYDMDILVEWRPREHELLQYADLHSKLVDVGDWAVSDSAYHQLCNLWRVQPTVDFFARPWSAKCSEYYTRFLMPGAAGTNAFDFTWHLCPPDLAYICPPHTVVPKVLGKILDERADCVLVLPAWYKAWHGLLQLLPVKCSMKLPASVLEWGDRAPAPPTRCHALLSGLQAYLILFSCN